MNRSELSLSMMGTWSTTMIRRSCTYGPPLFAPGGGGETIPYAGTPVPGLLHCGDSTFPGIGLPSAAASGMNAANTLVSPLEQLALLQEIEDVRKQSSSA